MKHHHHYALWVSSFTFIPEAILSKLIHEFKQLLILIKCPNLLALTSAVNFHDDDDDDDWRRASTLKIGSHSNDLTNYDFIIEIKILHELE